MPEAESAAAPEAPPAGPLPYVAAFYDPQISLPLDFDVDAIPFLQAIELIQVERMPWVITKWDSKHHYDNGGATRFFQKTGYTQKACVYEGQNLKLRQRKPRFWQWQRVYLAVVTFLAIVGNFEVVAGLFWDLFDLPKVSVEPKPRHVRMVEGDELPAEILLHNLAHSSTDIHVASAEVSPAGPIAARSVEVDLRLERAKSEAATVELHALKQGVCQVHLTGRAKAGRMMFGKDLPAAPGLEIEVWPELDNNPGKRLLVRGPQDADLYVTFKHGRPPARVSYTAVLPARTIDQTDFELVETFPGTPANSRPSTPEEMDFGYLKWQEDSTPLRPQTFRIALHASRPIQDVGWNPVKDALEVTADIIKPKPSS